MLPLRLALVASGLLAISCAGAPPPEAEPEHATTPAVTASSQSATPPPNGSASAEVAHKGPPHWTYAGEFGPDRWGDLSTDFTLCKKGTKQTPIDLSSKAPAGKELGTLALAYAPIPLLIQNNGHAVLVANSAKGSMTAGSERYDLVQFHFHSPSEHTLDGKHFDLELHLVHKNAKGELAVVGIFFKAGAENTALAPMFDRAPTEASPEPVAVPGVAIDLSSILRPKAAYFTYAGSLTTPPCSEGVSWFVFAEPREASAAQIAKLRAALHGDTNRPVQPSGSRPVLQFRP